MKMHTIYENIKVHPEPGSSDIMFSLRNQEKVSAGHLSNI